MTEAEFICILCHCTALLRASYLKTLYQHQYLSSVDDGESKSKDAPVLN
jgi:hypothetical protein